MQKFLKSLGYLSVYDRPAEVDEQIQMHADTLYHRMLEQEKATEAAKEASQSIPTFPPLLSTQNVMAAARAVPKSSTQPAQQSAQETTQQPAIAKSESATEKAAKAPLAKDPEYKKRLENLKGRERDLEEQAIQGEIQAARQLAGNLEGLYNKQEEERKKRKEEGKQTIGDFVKNVFGN